MPTALPGMSVTEAQRVLQIQDRILRSFPEVERVFGKAGRADTPTDPAPLSMVETTVVLKPESRVAHGRALVLRLAAPDPRARRPHHARPHHLRGAAGRDGRRAAASRHARTSGPCRSRTASTCCRPACARRSASRSSAPTSTVIQTIGEQLEALLRAVPGTRSVFAERTAGGYYLDFDLDRDAAGALRARRSTTRRRSSVGDRRRDRHHHRRGPRALPGERALRPRVPRRPRRAARACWCRRRPARRSRWRSSPTLRQRRGPGDDPQRERPARRLRLRRRAAGATSAATSTEAKRVRRASGSTCRPATRSCGAASTRTWCACASGSTIVVPLTLFLIALLLYLNTGSAVKTGDRAARRAVLAGRRGLAALGARLQHLDRGLGRHDRAHGPRRRDRRLHAALSSTSPTTSASRQGRMRDRAPICDEAIVARRGQARAAEDDDGDARRSWACCRSCGRPAPAPT